MNTWFEKPDASHFSLGEGFLEHYMTSAEPMSAAAHLSNHMVWSSILDASQDWSRLRTVWLSVLAPRGLLVRGPRGQIGAVLYSSVHGMLLLRCSMQKQDGLFWIVFDEAGKERSLIDVFYAGVYELKGWTAVEVKPLPPQVARAEGFGGSCSRILLSTPKSSTKSLMSACADTGFRQLTVPLLQRLIDELQIPFVGKRPTLEREVAALVIQWVYPSMSAEEVDALVERRKLRRPREFQSVLTEANASVVEAACGGERGDQDLVQDAKTEAAISQLGKGTARVSRQAPRPKNGPSSSSSSGACEAASQRPAAPPPPAPVAPARRQAIEMRAYTAEQARAFVPQGVKGVSLSYHVKVAWMVTYRAKPDYPRSHTCTFTLGDAQSEFDALVQCLVWVWRVHKQLANVDCPWDLGTPI